MSYDKELRHRALAYWAAGHSKKETATVFKVGTTTLQRWKSQLNESGTLSPKKRRKTWRKLEPGKLEAYLNTHPDAYLKDIAEAFGCSDVAVIKALRRLNISRKKNRPLQGI